MKGESGISVINWLLLAAAINFAATTWYVTAPGVVDAAEVARDAVQTASDLEKAGEWGEAVEIYQTVLLQYQYTPYAAKSLYRLARIDLRVNFDVQEAREKLRSVIDEFPHSPEASDARGDLRFMEEHWDHEGEPLVMWYKASAAHRSGEDQKTIAILRELIEKYPEAKLVPKAYYQIAQVHESAGNVTEAINTYQQVINRDPESKEAVDAYERQKKLAHR